MKTAELARKQSKHNAQQVKSRQEHSHMNMFNYHYFKTNTINGLFYQLKPGPMGQVRELRLCHHDTVFVHFL